MQAKTHSLQVSLSHHVPIPNPSLQAIVTSICSIHEKRLDALLLPFLHGDPIQSLMRGSRQSKDHRHKYSALTSHLNDFAVPEAILISLGALGDIANHEPISVCILALRDSFYRKPGASEPLAVLTASSRR